MTIPEVQHADAQLLAWDWRSALRADERTIPWLAKHTNRSSRAVYAYAYGQRETPIEWLRAAARALGRSDLV